MPAAAAVLSDALWRGGEQVLGGSAASLLQAGVNDARLDIMLDEGDRLRD